MDTGCMNPMCKHHSDGAKSLCDSCEAIFHEVYTMGYLAGVEDAMKHLDEIRIRRNYP